MLLYITVIGPKKCRSGRNTPHNLLAGCAIKRSVGVIPPYGANTCCPSLKPFRISTWSRPCRPSFTSLRRWWSSSWTITKGLPARPRIACGGSQSASGLRATTAVIKKRWGSRPHSDRRLAAPAIASGRPSALRLGDRSAGQPAQGPHAGFESGLPPGER